MARGNNPGGNPPPVPPVPPVPPIPPVPPMPPPGPIPPAPPALPAVPDPIEFKAEWLAIATKLHGTLLDKVVPQLGNDLPLDQQYTRLKRKLSNWKQIKAITPRVSQEDIDGLAASVILTREIARHHLKDYGKVVRTELHDAARGDAATVLQQMGVMPDLLGGLGDQGQMDQHGRPLLNAAGAPIQPRVEMGKRLAQAVDNARDDNWYGRLKKGIKFGPKKIVRAIVIYAILTGWFLIYSATRFPDVMWWIFAILLGVSVVWGLVGMIRGHKLLHTLTAFTVIFIAGVLMLMGVAFGAKAPNNAVAENQKAQLRSCADGDIPGCDQFGRQGVTVSTTFFRPLLAACTNLQVRPLIPDCVHIPLKNGAVDLDPNNKDSWIPLICGLEVNQGKIDQIKVDPICAGYVH